MYNAPVEKMLERQVTRRWILKGMAAATAVLADKIYLPSSTASAKPEEIIPQIPREFICPIDYFHEISSKDSFERYLYQISVEDFFPIRLSSVSTYLTEGIQTWPEDKKPRVITFDDILKSQLRNAVPILEKWQVQATFAAMPDWEGDGVHEYISMEELKEIAQTWEIANHTWHHPSLNKLRMENYGSWLQQIITSKSRLEEITGQEIYSFVYPNGAYDLETVDLVSKNYKIAVSTRKGILLNSEELFTLPRQRMS